MSQHEEEEIELVVKKRKPKRNIIVEDDDNDDLDTTTIEPLSNNITTTSLNTNTTTITQADDDINDEDRDQDEIEKNEGYVKKNRAQINGIDLSDKLVQLSTKTEIKSSGLDSSLISKQITSQIDSTTSFSTMGAKTAGKLKVQSAMDYAADICKDYKLYGYCPWGETCIFIHDRSERKSGNQLDAEYNAMLDKKAEMEANLKVLKIPDNDKIPTQCLICGELYNIDIESEDQSNIKKQIENIIITNCQHFFHKKCAMQRFSHSQTCATCDNDTKGRFTSSLIEINRRIDKTKELTQKHKLFLEQLAEDEKKGNRKALLKGKY